MPKRAKSDHRRNKLPFKKRYVKTRAMTQATGYFRSMARPQLLKPILVKQKTWNQTWSTAKGGWGIAGAGTLPDGCEVGITAWQPKVIEASNIDMGTYEDHRIGNDVRIRSIDLRIELKRTTEAIPVTGSVASAGCKTITFRLVLVNWTNWNNQPAGSDVREVFRAEDDGNFPASVVTNRNMTFAMRDLEHTDQVKVLYDRKFIFHGRPAYAPEAYLQENVKQIRAYVNLDKSSKYDKTTYMRHQTEGIPEYIQSGYLEWLLISDSNDQTNNVIEARWQQRVRFDDA